MNDKNNFSSLISEIEEFNSPEYLMEKLNLLSYNFKSEIDTNTNNFLDLDFNNNKKLITLQNCKKIFYFAFGKKIKKKTMKDLLTSYKIKSRKEDKNISCENMQTGRTFMDFPENSEFNFIDENQFKFLYSSIHIDIFFSLCEILQFGSEKFNDLIFDSGIISFNISSSIQLFFIQ